MGKISAETISALKARVDSTTSNPNGAAGLVYVAVDRDGDFIFEHASGKRGLGVDQPMTLDTVFWVASCTKMITGIAAMQLVEQGKLSLDDVEQVERLAPELKAVKVLEKSADGKLSLVDKKQGITLRMLLTHTAGFGYTFFNPKLKTWYEPIGIDEFTGNPADVLGQPLVNQPGEKWEYGVSLDWVGELVARVSGLPLNEYFLKNVFEPIGVKDINLFPTDDMKRRLAYMHQKSPDGTLNLREGGHIFLRPLTVQTPEEIKSVLNSGGGGAFAVPSEYCQIIATLLNSGTHPKSGVQILKPETVNDMLSNHIPQFPNFGRQGIVTTKPTVAGSTPELYPQPHDQTQGWGLSFFHHDHGTPTGRAPGTVFWSGLPNCFWWADRERGLGGMIASQILPHGDMDVMTCWAEVEAGLYAALAKEREGKL